MTLSFFTDAYTDWPTTQGGELEERVRHQVRVLGRSGRR